MNLFLSVFLFSVLFVRASGQEAKADVFDMDAIRDATTLDVWVIDDWHVVKGRTPTRQKLIEIHVGEMWPGQAYRMPVRLVVPVDRKARGFHLTGGSTPERIKRDLRVGGVDEDLIAGGVGIVHTVVQVLQQSGLRQLARESEERFAKSLNPQHKIQYWAWPATLMRAITAAYAEEDHVEKGKILGSGGSKNGATPSMAMIHDERITAVHASVSPIWDSPLRSCEASAWNDYEVGLRGFLGGHFGPSFYGDALDAGRSWDDLRAFAKRMSKATFVASNVEELEARGCEFLFHPGTHDVVCYDLAWGGAEHPDIPLYLGANTGHGMRGGHPGTMRQMNKHAFVLRHFFPEKIEAFLPPPVLTTILDGDRLTVTARFAKGEKPENGHLFWMVDRPDDGTKGYVKEPIGKDDWREMDRGEDGVHFTASIEIPTGASRLDLFSNHRKTLRFEGRPLPSVISSPYTRVDVRK